MFIPSLSQHLLMTSVLKDEPIAPLDVMVSAGSRVARWPRVDRRHRPTLAPRVDARLEPPVSEPCGSRGPISGFTYRRFATERCIKRTGRRMALRREGWHDTFVHARTNIVVFLAVLALSALTMVWLFLASSGQDIDCHDRGPGRARSIGAACAVDRDDSSNPKCKTASSASKDRRLRLPAGARWRNRMPCCDGPIHRDAHENHFPMQKLPKIAPSKSSLVNSPVISPSARCASRRSSANSSNGVVPRGASAQRPRTRARARSSASRCRRRAASAPESASR